MASITKTNTSVQGVLPKAGLEKKDTVKAVVTESPAPIIGTNPAQKPQILKVTPAIVTTQTTVKSDTKSIVETTILNQPKQKLNAETIMNNFGIGYESALIALGVGAVGAVPLIGLFDGVGALASLVSAFTLADPLKASLAIAGAAVALISLGSLVYFGINQALVKNAKSKILKDPELPQENKEALLRFFSELKIAAKLLKNKALKSAVPAENIKGNKKLVKLEEKANALKKNLDKKTIKELISKLERARINFEVTIYKLLNKPKGLNEFEISLLKAVIGETYVNKKLASK